MNEISRRSPANARILLDSHLPAVLEPLRSHGHHVFVADLAHPSATHVRELLQSVEIVLMDVTAASRSILGTLHSLSGVIGQCDVGPRLLCFSAAHRNEQFIQAIQRCGARYVRVGDAAMLLEAIALLLADMEELRRNGPSLHIIHRFARGICAPGETVDACLLAGAPDPQLHLALSERLTLDYLSRHRRIGLDARQIAAGLNGEWFYRDHGVNSGVRQSTRVRTPAVKVIIGRIRDALAFKSAEAHLGIDPFDVIQSLPAAGSNRVLYKLRADCRIIHSP